MKILLCPDSYKGCLSSSEVCAAMTEGIIKANPNAEILQYPSSDGGEGFCDCMINLYGGVRVSREVTYPMGNKGTAGFIYNKNTSTAYIELATAAGLNLVEPEKRNILHATTYGVGELISHAVDLGAVNIIIGLGGSATNDYGIGMLAALGAVFIDKNGYFVAPYAENIESINCINTDNMLDFTGINIVAACDVKNPLCGEYGAARVFAKQKGATQLEIEYLDRIAQQFCNRLNIDVNKQGYGAAGGIGMAIIEFLNGTYVSGASLLINSESFSTALQSADLVITGEGNTDAQTANGKLVSEVAKTAKVKNVPVYVLSGGLSAGYEKLYDLGVTKCFSLAEDGYDIDYCIKNAYELIRDRIHNTVISNI